jgi:hypothetical protein
VKTPVWVSSKEISAALAGDKFVNMKMGKMHKMHKMHRQCSAFIALQSSELTIQKDRVGKINYSGQASLSNILF